MKKALRWIFAALVCLAPAFAQGAGFYPQTPNPTGAQVLAG